jgi:O-antigen/teichoic acid export membrane protein
MISAHIQRLGELRELARRHWGGVLAYLTSTASLTVGLVAHTVGFVVLAQSLGASQFGVLTIITTVVNLGLVWSGLGSGELLRRTIARDRSRYPEVFGHAVSILIATSATIGLGIALGLAWWVPLREGFAANLALMILFVASNMTMFAWISMTEQILLAHDEVANANLVNIASGAGRAVAAIVACYGFGISQVREWVFWHFGFYAAISVGCALVIARLGAPRLGVLWHELRRGVTVSLTGQFMFLRNNADILALSAVASPAVVGIYSVARRIVGTASVVSEAIDRLVYSKLAVAGANGVAATMRLAIRYAAIASVICVATSLVLWVCAPLIPWIFGAQYASAVWATQVLAWTLVLTSLQNLASDALNAAEQHEIRLAAETGAGIVGTAVLVALTLSYALPGILAAVYVAGILTAAALWGTLLWRARTSTGAT